VNQLQDVTQDQLRDHLRDHLPDHPRDPRFRYEEDAGDAAPPPAAARPKLAVVVRDDLLVWQKLNVTAFLTSGFGVRDPGLVGAPYVDGDGRRYQAMFAQPVAVLAADAAGLRRAFDRALARDLDVAVYTDDLFATGNDADNRAAVAAVATGDLVLAGFAVCGERRAVDKALDRLRLHP
jgi:hypothetical protein